MSTLLTPLQRFYTNAGRPVPAARELAGDEIPEPYRSLLVHDSDMTSTLRRFHDGPIDLRILESRRDESSYQREVVLMTGDVPVEFGAIRILMDQFSEAVQKEIVEGAKPLGAILQEFDIPFVSAPRAFFEIEAEEVMIEALRLKGEKRLYGRHNELKRPQGDLLAEIIEILPPIETKA